MYSVYTLDRTLYDYASIQYMYNIFTFIKLL